MTRIAPWTIAVAGLLLFAVPSEAVFVTIDDFATPNPGAPAGNFIINPPVGNNNPTVLVFPTNFASTRTSTFQVDSTPGVFSLLGTIGYDPVHSHGVLDFNSSNSTRARAILHYSGFDAVSGNFYSTGIPKFLYLDFLILDSGLNVSTNTQAANIPVDIAISTTGGAMGISTFMASTNVPFQYQIPFTSFAGFGDLSHVLSVDITLNAGPNQRQATDYTLQNVTFETIPFPLPPSVLFALGGMPVLAILRRRRR